MMEDKINSRSQVCLGQNGAAVGEGPRTSTPMHPCLCVLWIDMAVDHLLRHLLSLPISKLTYENVLARSPSVISGRGHVEK